MTKLSIPLFALALAVAPSLSFADTNSSLLTRAEVRAQQSSGSVFGSNTHAALHPQSHRAMDPFHGGSPVYYGGLAAHPELARSGIARSAIEFRHLKNPFHGGTSAYYGALAANQQIPEQQSRSLASRATRADLRASSLPTGKQS